ncbi:CPBP family intramembrane glutamic endopeptidase [Actinosynnema sp. ALI-1.44]|uniref:CPBP family intramembrane glutamic endopeptidase n=1 Tax=Actinosynnema sp. ALI-1.44 TaxID=1933779 RepID=UPI001EDB09E9|nr:CPBP family intramembrane glutamic endopeptidase [Actinosynnema sp. ALI-1.44]
MANRLRAWLAPQHDHAVVTDPAERRSIKIELVIVFAVTLGMSGARSLLSLADSLLRPEPLSSQSVALNVPQAKLDLLDLLKQLLSATQLFGWGALGLYLLWRAGKRLTDVGLDRRFLGGDTLRGVGLAALIGIPGLGLYLVAYAIGANLEVMPTTLTDTWWRPIALTISAAGNAWAEEVLVVGYLITRLRQLGFGENKSLLVSSVLRGSYHLYQGFGGFVGNVVMGLVFGRVWQRTTRLWPLVIAHTLLDVVAFVGYSLLRGVSWLP